MSSTASTSISWTGSSPHEARTAAGYLHDVPTRIFFVVLVIGVIATACVPGADDTPETTSAQPAVTTTASSPTTTVAQGDLEAPERGDPDDVAWETFVTHDQITSYGDDRVPQDVLQAAQSDACCKSETDARCCG